MNFTYTLTTPQNGKFGRLREDGTWDGMVRLLQDGDVDIGLLCVFFECKQALLVVLKQESIWKGGCWGDIKLRPRRQRIMYYTDVDTTNA